MKTLELVAITNFILASTLLFFSGLLMGQQVTFYSAGFYWSAAMLFLGISSLAGGIDHGFFQPKGDTLARIIIQRTTWIFVAFTAVFTALTVLRQFFGQFSPYPGYAAILVYFAIFIYIIFYRGKFINIILIYFPVMLLYLVLNIIHLGSGTGSWVMITGLTIAFAASFLKLAGFHKERLFNDNCWYHAVGTISAVFLYLGGVQIPV